MPGKDPVQLTERAANRIIRGVADWEGFVKGHPPRSRRPMPSDGGTAILFGKAKSGTDNSTASATVNPCDDLRGTDPDTDTEHTVITRATDRMDPNVRVDDVIAYVQNVDDTYSCIYGNNLDAKIGSVILWHNVAAIPAGWQEADGTNGTRDLESKFIVGYDAGDADYNALAKTGGAKDHDHTEHAAHNHTVTGTLVESGVQDATVAACAVTGNHGPQTHSTQDHRPPYYVLQYIQRID